MGFPFTVTFTHLQGIAEVLDWGRLVVDGVGRGVVKDGDLRDFYLGGSVGFDILGADMRGVEVGLAKGGVACLLCGIAFCFLNFVVGHCMGVVVSHFFYSSLFRGLGAGCSQGQD